VSWLKRTFIAGFFVTVPLIISVAAIVWIFQLVDGATRPLAERILGRAVPGLGLLITASIILLVGAAATNMIGKRVLQRAEYYLMLVPGFRTIYAPVKQLVAAFSPDNEAGFKKVVIVEDARRGMLLGFLTKEFVIDRGHGPEPVVAVYVPTNHLYLGDIVVFPRDQVIVPDLSVEEGIRIFLTGGMALPHDVHADASPSRQAVDRRLGDGSAVRQERAIRPANN
jgi:uncharacterized membrane protein